jgi:hypothetical protein
MSRLPRDEEKFDDDEARRRFEAALRGARQAEPRPMKNIPRKRGKIVPPVSERRKHEEKP